MRVESPGLDFWDWGRLDILDLGVLQVRTLVSLALGGLEATQGADTCRKLNPGVVNPEYL